MKKVLLFLLVVLFFSPVIAPAAVSAEATSKEALASLVVLPERQGIVNDYFDAIDIPTTVRIEELAKELKHISSIDLAVALVRTTRPLKTEEYGRRLFDKWQIGRQEQGLDHGVLLLISVIDRDVKLITGSGVDFMFPPEGRETMEMSLYPLLGRGKIQEAAYLGIASIDEYILSEWPKYVAEGKRRMTFKIASQVFFVLTAISVFLTLIYGGTFLTAFATVVGGIIGFLLLQVPGMLLGAAMGFLMNLGQVERKMTDAEKELKELYDKWKEQKGGKKSEN
jgi:uncharacterized membrane protein YgcG